MMEGRGCVDVVIVLQRRQASVSKNNVTKFWRHCFPVKLKQLTHSTIFQTNLHLVVKSNRMHKAPKTKLKFCLLNFCEGFFYKMLEDENGTNTTLDSANESTVL